MLESVPCTGVGCACVAALSQSLATALHPSTSANQLKPASHDSLLHTDYLSSHVHCLLTHVHLQVFEVATDSGADDIVPSTDDDDQLEGYKVSTQYPPSTHCTQYPSLQALLSQFQECSANIHADSDSATQAHIIALVRPSAFHVTPAALKVLHWSLHCASLFLSSGSSASVFRTCAGHTQVFAESVSALTSPLCKRTTAIMATCTSCTASDTSCVHA